MLDQDAHEPLHAAERGAVDHHRPVRLVVGAGVLQPEPLGQDVIELHGAELPFPADAVADDEIGLRPVERRLAGRLLVGQAHLVEHRADVVLGPSPDVAGRTLVLGIVRVALREPDAVVGQSQARVEEELRHLHRRAELASDLLVGAEQVGVVLGEAADAGQPRELARLLVAVDRAELGQPQRQIAVAPRLRGVDLDVVRAVHRLEQVFLDSRRSARGSRSARPWLISKYDRLEPVTGWPSAVVR